jgi:two-component system NtrC family sensor kinase
LHPVVTERISFLDALTSIIKNAYEAIDSNGQVTITTRNTEFNGRNVVEIKVADTGKGIPVSDLPKIFDLFYTTKGGRGLGFGLWRDRIFIKKLGGEIDVQSAENKGSTFIIRIPVKQNSK